jgi:acyl carrier protein
MNANTENTGGPTMANVPTDQEALEAIREELANIKVPGAESAEPDQTWADLDVDSLDLVEVVKSLEDRFDIRIADARLKGIASVGDAIALVQELAKEKEGAAA